MKYLGLPAKAFKFPLSIQSNRSHAQLWWSTFTVWVIVLRQKNWNYNYREWMNNTTELTHS